jgi:hypothetical protein
MEVPEDGIVPYGTKYHYISVSFYPYSVPNGTFI